MRHTLSLFCFYKIFYFHPLTSIWNDNKRNFNARCFKRIDNLWKTKKRIVLFIELVYDRISNLNIYDGHSSLSTELRHNTNDIVKYKDSYWVPVIHPFNYTTDYRRLSLTHTHTLSNNKRHISNDMFIPLHIKS